MVLERGTLFDPVLVTDLVNKVKGKSSLARLSQQQPIPFNGQKEFVFTMDNEIDVVAESGKKSHGGVSLAPRTIVPIKVEYGARVSDEFMYAADEERINILKAFNDGFANKAARGLDLMAFHGVNPRTGNASAVIGNNHFDALVTQAVEAPFGMNDANGVIESAIALVHGSDGDVTGMAIAPSLRSALAKQKDQQGNPMFPELAWGNAPDSINGLPVDVNRTVSDMSDNARAYVGDFQNGFKWGYAKQIPLEIIQYGDPDNSGLDLKGYNQVYIRAELYLGWGILDPGSFARITEAGE
ncbi:phage major capsid protein [Caldibacillus thermoamylovorans]|uniref:phage major capsid protein n=1 Tax=Caldibacillus thermoamylovorans TaxID=35841 RepID=UPI001D06D107|nr:phage major capsid protein [Caldibacillus thermoamylovorans]MCB5934489.1 phage major capsid protein [Bacillus sp. DFI.2.34]MCB7076464.1 phage major capsid protein [Caldibacillus thermoamylovorans]